MVEEDISHKKNHIESIRRQLQACTKEKAKYEMMYNKAREELDKRVSKQPTNLPLVFPNVKMLSMIVDFGANRGGYKIYSRLGLSSQYRKKLATGSFIKCFYSKYARSTARVALAKVIRTLHILVFKMTQRFYFDVSTTVMLIHLRWFLRGFQDFIFFFLVRMRRK